MHHQATLCFGLGTDKVPGGIEWRNGCGLGAQQTRVHFYYKWSLWTCGECMIGIKVEAQRNSLELRKFSAQGLQDIAGGLEPRFTTTG